MRRKNHLYENTYKIENIEKVFSEITKNTKNKAKVQRFRDYKCINITRIHDVLEKREYIPGPYNRFVIYEPKKRNIVSQGMIDKAVNHLVARHILMPAIIPCLIDQNVASREKKGTKAGIEYFQRYKRACDRKYNKNYYILKCDISKFFASVDHDILKRKLERKIKDKDALKIVFDIIDSEENGLGIGNMTSQILAIFYLNDLDHFIKEQLHIKYYVRYQDDFVLFHYSKEYLQFCLEEITKFLKKEKLVLNSKTRIYKNTNKFIFLGRDFSGKYARYREVNKKIRKRRFDYENGKISLNEYCSTRICYENLRKSKKKKSKNIQK